MTNRFRRGLVVGKFSPLHRGHEVVIRRASELCREVVIISYSKPEFARCEAVERERWLAELFPTARRLVVTDEMLAAFGDPEYPALPANEADETTHRRFVAFLCLRMLGLTVDAVFTSEAYGDGFARELTAAFQQQQPASPPVAHFLVDRGRVSAPISGTVIRQDPHHHRSWLAPGVYASFVARICLLGGESSGKSTLAEALAQRWSTVVASEYGRELWEAKQGHLVFDDLLAIAQQQVVIEESALLRASRFLFCDTSPLTTLFYSRHSFGRADPRLETLADRRYDRLVLCAPDFPFVQDGTRQAAPFREAQHRWYLDELARRRWPYFLATKSLAERVEQISELLEGARTARPQKF